MTEQVTQGATVAAFAYDPEHNRITHTTSSGTTIYLNDPDAGVMEEQLAGAGTSWKTYLVADGRIVAQRYLNGPNTTMLYFMADNLGSTSVLTDLNGAVKEQVSFDAWGRRRNPNGTGLGCSPFAPAKLTTRGYTGQEMLDAFCLVNLNARLYDPQIGRFIAADSIIPDTYNPQSLNRYRYVGNFPLSTTDPTGHAGDPRPQWLDDDPAIKYYGYGTDAAGNRDLPEGSYDDVSHAVGNGETAATQSGSGVSSNNPISADGQTVADSRHVDAPGNPIESSATQDGDAKTADETENANAAGGKVAAAGTDGNTILATNGEAPGDGTQIAANPAPSPKFAPPTNPAQSPPDQNSLPPGYRVRVMPPTSQYPNGYWVIEKQMDNGGWQKINPSTMKPGAHPDTHVPLPPALPSTVRPVIPEGPFILIPAPVLQMEACMATGSCNTASLNGPPPGQ